MKRLLYKAKNYEIVYGDKDIADILYKELSTNIKHPFKKKQIKHLVKSLTNMTNSRITLVMYKDSEFVGYSSFKQINKNKYKVLRMFIVEKYRKTKALTCFGDFILNKWLIDKELISTTDKMPGFYKRIIKENGEIKTKDLNKLRATFHKICKG